MHSSERPIALVTGVGRRAGIAAGVVQRMAQDGWDIGATWWSAYDDRMPWGRRPDDVTEIGDLVRGLGARFTAVEADLEEPAAAGNVVDAVRSELGEITALVMCHCESVDSGILDTEVEAFDRHFAVNTRASWLLIKAYAEQLTARDGSGRIIALTSDHTAYNLPYGASKGALDRIVIAAAEELGHLRISANVINPGPIDTGWMNDGIRELGVTNTALGRLGTPQDTAALVSFLVSPDGGWINGQLLHSNGGFNL